MSYAGSAEVLLIEARRKFRANSVRTELAEGLRLTDEGRMVASTRDKASGSSAGGASDGPQRLPLARAIAALSRVAKRIKSSRDTSQL